MTDADPDPASDPGSDLEPTRDIRVHLDAAMAPALGAGEAVPAPKEVAHYLLSVMRAISGDRIRVFNGRDGEWLAEIAAEGKRAATLTPIRRLRPPAAPPDLWLVFAPIKKARTDFIVEKAAELGCRRVLPVRTARTQSDRINRERLQAHAVEAAEQCELVFVPDVADLAPLASVLAAWPEDRTLWFCDEARDAPPLQNALSATAPGPAGLLIGPEGGFTPAEAQELRARPYVRSVSLGPRLLRADTAAAAALALWQAAHGDWQAGAPG